MFDMLGVIFYEQRSIATEFGFILKTSFHHEAHEDHEAFSESYRFLCANQNGALVCANNTMFFFVYFRDLRGAALEFRIIAVEARVVFRTASVSPRCYLKDALCLRQSLGFAQ